MGDLLHVGAMSSRQDMAIETPTSQAKPWELVVQRDVRIPMRDGIHLSATIYLTEGQRPSPCIAALTPYMADHLHDRGVHFAGQGFAFIAVDVRGRGDSEGDFRPWLSDAADGYDFVEWTARQAFCNGKVGMYGGSYLGYTQWATAKERPPHLFSLTPTSAPFMGVDVPMRNNIFTAYELRWLTLVSGRSLRLKLFSDNSFWSALFRHWHESGLSMRALDTVLGTPCAAFQEILDHPTIDAYWDAHNPTNEEYSEIDIPVLTITGIYDGDQAGALQHYRQHLLHAPTQAGGEHFLVIGPWNHEGCARPNAEFDGLKIGPDGVIDMYQLHSDWYAWTLCDGERPQFLKDRVAYYVMGSECWRYAASLEEITTRVDRFYLHSLANPLDLFASGQLSKEIPGPSGPDSYVYDPRDVSRAAVESASDWLSDMSSLTMMRGAQGKQLIYHTPSFTDDVEVSGFFKLRVWLSIDQRDTDFRVWICDIDDDGRGTLMTMDSIRARHRCSLRQETLIDTAEPLEYSFDRFPFVSRLIRRGHRLRMIIGPINSIYEEKNYNSGKVVSDESIVDSHTVQVRLFHDLDHPSVLEMPVGRRDRDRALSAFAIA